MQATFYFTAEERKAFAALSEALRNGWSVEEERGTSTDDLAHRDMRLHLLRVRSPKVTTIVKKALQENTVEGIARILNDTDLKGVHDADLAELFFVLGPGPLSILILNVLRSAKTDEDLQGIMALTVIRHSLFQSMASSPRKR